MHNLFISSEFKRDGSYSDFSFQLPRPIDVSKSYRAMVDQIHVPHVFPTITSNNRALYFEEVSSTPSVFQQRKVLLDEGNYSGDQLAAHFPVEGSSENRVRSRERFVERYSNTDRYGNYVLAAFDNNTGEMVEPGSVDTILTFRNVHNFMMGNYAEKAFDDFYMALREGGTLGVVDHRLPSTREQDPQARSGYVQQDYVIGLGEEAGFELVSASEVNANPADTADHPFGVWTLAPTRRSAPRGQEAAADFDRSGYDAIGESDRMTLLFRKPVSE